MPRKPGCSNVKGGREYGRLVLADWSWEVKDPVHGDSRSDHLMLRRHSRGTGTLGICSLVNCDVWCSGTGRGRQEDEGDEG